MNWRSFVKPFVLIVVSLLVARIVIGLIGSVDWAGVASALGQVSWPAIPLLILLLLIRQAFNAVPLAKFVSGLGWWRSAQNDVTANLIGTVAPPPGDVVIRVGMFKSWGIPPVDGMAGVTLNMLVFYVIRFAVPVLGLLVLIREEVSTGHIWLAFGSLLIAAAIIVALILVSRGERLAWLIGHTAGRVAARLKEGPDPEVWGAAVVDFRGRMSDRLVRGLPISLLALTAMVLADCAILVTALRAVGVSSEVLPLVWILGGFLIAYPLTALPLAGIGVLDATLVVAFSKAIGDQWESDLIAGFVVWRVVTIGGPLLLGLIAMLVWRWRSRRAEEADASVV